MYISSLISPYASARISDYVELLKPRVMSLVVFTAMVGMFLAPGHLPPLAAFMVVFAIALGGGAAGAANMWIERDTDALMQRTKNRPIPAGRVSAQHALNFSVVCAAISLIIMACAANMLATLLLLTAILFYVFIYTLWLKPRTAMNIVIGGAAGALPPVIGWAAVAGNVSLEPVILFLLIFLWTPPHFWALALVKSDDYKNAGIPMLPTLAGHAATIRQIFAYTLVLLPVSLVPSFMHMTGLLYMVGATSLGLGFVFHSMRLWQHKDLSLAMPMFKYSLFYLFGIFALLVLDKLALSYIGF